MAIVEIFSMLTFVSAILDMKEIYAKSKAFATPTLAKTEENVTTILFPIVNALLDTLDQLATKDILIVL